MELSFDELKRLIEQEATGVNSGRSGVHVLWSDRQTSTFENNHGCWKLFPSVEDIGRSVMLGTSKRYIPNKADMTSD